MMHGGMMGGGMTGGGMMGGGMMGGGSAMDGMMPGMDGTGGAHPNQQWRSPEPAR